jgi:hypothetical protein
MAWFALASVLKATNEPSLSNKWSFYSSAEASAVFWIDEHAKTASIWSGIDERLASMFIINYASSSESENHYDFGDFKEENDYLLYSRLERQRELRLKNSPPPVFFWSRIYDSGEVQIFSHYADLTKRQP